MFGGYAGQLGGKIAGAMFKKKQQQEAEAAAGETPTAAAAPPATIANGMITPLRITSELVSVKKDATPASIFEVPADFKRVAKSD